MNYWLAKSEPDVYAWETLVQDGHTLWTGVRNYQARNNLAAMKVGDLVCFYHSNARPPLGKSIVGIARAKIEAVPDPTIEDARWVAVTLEPLYALKKSVSLEQFKQDEVLSGAFLVKNSRLSVQPVSAAEFARVLELAGHGQ